MDGLLAHPFPTSKGPDMLPDKPIREHPKLPGDPSMDTNSGDGKRHALRAQAAVRAS
jgi:hypothetical protein